ncbi:MAG TPA: FecR domain-containing protein [Cyclobacteriaceae bacterium]
MKEEFDHIDDLIGKYLAGEATDGERLELENWIAENESNTAYFNHFRLIFERAKKISGSHRFDAEKAWIKIKSEMSGSKGKTIAFTPYWNVFRIAALLIVGAGIAFFAYQWLQTPDEVVTLASQNKVVNDTLPDGSLTVLNKNTKIQYAYNSSNNKRKVVLEGEAFFEVKYQEEKPFIIETGGVIIEDIGTTFNVNAFPENPIIEVYVETGQVAFYTLNDNGLNLVAGETGIFDKRSQLFARLLKKDTNRLAYKTGIFSFRNADLATIISDLNSVYDKKIRLGNPDLKNCRLNVIFRNEQIEDIVEIIAETLKLTLTKEGEDFVLNGTSCGD